MYLNVCEPIKLFPTFTQAFIKSNFQIYLSQITPNFLKKNDYIPRAKTNHSGIITIKFKRNKKKKKYVQTNPWQDN